MADCTVVLADLSKSTVYKIQSIAQILKTIGVEPNEQSIFADTWGDAFVAVFQSAHAALMYGLDVRDVLRFHDWRAQGISHVPQLRIAIATGPLGWKDDKLQGRTVPEGEVLVKAARIEPIVSPGEVLVTDTVKNLAGETDFYFEDLGLRQLSKDYGSARLFRAFRNEEKDAVSEGLYGPLTDDQFFRRAEALRRFAYLWLLLDQLPVGSWGRSIPEWMREVWRGIPELTPNAIMEDEGGFETTILNLEILSSVLGPARLLQGIGGRAIEYLRQRHGPRGFGTLGLTRQGFAIEPHPRHTALAGWLLGKVIKNMTLNIPELSNLFRTSALALLAGDPAITGRAFQEDRNPLLLYMAAWHVNQQCLSPDWSYLFNEEELKHMEKTWSASENILIEKALATRYDQGRPRELVVGREMVFPLTIPYGGFVRMEAYSLLSATMLLDAGMPNRLRQRVGDAVKFIIDDYFKFFGETKNRYTRDPLRALPRGPRPFFSDLEKCKDLGTAAMLLRVLRTPKVMQALWDEQIPISVPKIRYYLNEDLTELFDRYLIEPRIFAFTHAGMIAALLPGDHEKLQKAIINKCQQVMQQPPPVELTEESIDKVLSEKRLAQLVEEIVVNDGVTPKIQLATHSLVRLLLDKLHPGRYIREKLSDKGVIIISRRTCDVYKRPAFVEKYDKIWGNSADLAILAPFIKLIKSGARILDVGCGPGQYSAELSRDGHEVVLLDTSSEFLKIASDRVIKATANKPLCFECNVLDQVTRNKVGSDCNYDAIWCSGLFVHIPIAKQPDVLNWLNNLLKPEGYLFINIIINNSCVLGRDNRFFNYIPAPSYFQAMLTDCGFETEYMLQRTIKENTYGEPFWEDICANFYVRKSRTIEGPKFGDMATLLTSLAYERSVDEFVKAHTPQDSARINIINGYLNKLQKFLDQRMPGLSYNILDLGCGPGDYVVEIARRGWKGIGIDISDKMIQYAREQCPPVLRHLAEFYVGNMCYLPDSWTEQFDAAICITAFQHVPFEDDHSLKALKEFARILRPGGVLRVDLQLGRETGYDPDLRFIRGLLRAEDMYPHFEEVGLILLEKKSGN